VTRSGLATLVAVLTVACSPQAWLDRAAESPEAQFAKESVALVWQQDSDSLLQRMAPDLRAQVTPDQLAKLYAQVPPGSPEQPVLVGYNYLASPSSKQALVSLQYPFPDAYVLVQVGVQSSGAVPSLYAFHLQRLPDALERLHAFVLRGKSVRHYLFLALALAVLTSIVVCLVLCVRTPLPRRKWLWVLFVSLGYGQFTMNWTTGEVATRPISFQLLGAGVQAAGPYAPWFVSFSAPFGALVFLYRRRQLQEAQRKGALGGVEQGVEADEAR
jgi:hypothetical protein